MRQKEIGDLPQTKISLAHLSNEIYQNLPSPDKSRTIIDLLRKLPFETSVPIIMCVLLHATPNEIASYLQISNKSVHRKKKLFVEIIKTYEK